MKDYNILRKVKIYKFDLVTVRSLAPICRSTTSTLFSEHFFRQSHTARERKIKRTYFAIRLLGAS